MLNNKRIYLGGMLFDNEELLKSSETENINIYISLNVERAKAPFMLCSWTAFWE